ncbi:TPA: glycosyltransferase family 2 protein, partial [Clostridium perfringens]|nr:glycosyltransferase family 2 protein [Clostridium perfringens]
MNKKLTVFMPVYNSERYLRKSIDSILNQSYKNFEFLIINDGSTDSSVDIINSYNDKRIKLINNKENKGIPYTRNLGLELSTGDYIAIMDSDDISYINRLEKQINYLELNPDIDILSSNFDELYNNSIIKSKSNNKNSDVIKIELMFRCCIGNPTVMMRRKTFVDNKINYREECFVAQDYSFWVESIKKCKFYHMKDSLIAYRTGHENITKKSSKNKQKRKNIIDKIRVRALEYNGFKLNERELYYFNKVFSDPKINLSVNDFLEVKKVLKKMVLINSNKNIF